MLKFVSPLLVLLVEWVSGATYQLGNIGYIYRNGADDVKAWSRACAFQAAVNHVNDDDVEYPDVNFAPMYRSTNGSATIGLAAALEMQAAGVVGTVGPYLSSVSTAVVDPANGFNVPAITLSGSFALGDRSKYPYFYRILGNAGQQVALLKEITDRFALSDTYEVCSVWDSSDTASKSFSSAVSMQFGDRVSEASSDLAGVDALATGFAEWKTAGECKFFFFAANDPIYARKVMGLAETAGLRGEGMQWMFLDSIVRDSTTAGATVTEKAGFTGAVGLNLLPGVETDPKYIAFLEEYATVRDVFTFEGQPANVGDRCTIPADEKAAAVYDQVFVYANALQALSTAGTPVTTASIDTAIRTAVVFNGASGSSRYGMDNNEALGAKAENLMRFKDDGTVENIGGYNNEKYTYDEELCILGECVTTTTPTPQSENLSASFAVSPLWNLVTVLALFSSGTFLT